MRVPLLRRWQNSQATFIDWRRFQHFQQPVGKIPSLPTRLSRHEAQAAFRISESSYSNKMLFTAQCVKAELLDKLIPSIADSIRSQLSDSSRFFLERVPMSLIDKNRSYTSEPFSANSLAFRSQTSINCFSFLYRTDRIGSIYTFHILFRSWPRIALRGDSGSSPSRTRENFTVAASLISWPTLRIS
jgi:hypothetical protein